MQKKSRYGLTVFLIAIILLSLVSCGKTGDVLTSDNGYENSEETQNNQENVEPDILTEITITAGDKKLD